MYERVLVRASRERVKRGEIMTHKEMMNIKYETCDLWNSLKDKSKIVDTLIDLKEQNLKLKAELAELKQNAIVPKFKVGDEVWVIKRIKQEIANGKIIKKIFIF